MYAQLRSTSYTVVRTNTLLSKPKEAKVLVGARLRSSSRDGSHLLQSKEKERAAVTAKSNTKAQGSQLLSKLKKLWSLVVASSSSLVFSLALWTLALTAGPVLTAFHQHLPPLPGSAEREQGVRLIAGVDCRPFQVASYHQQHSEHHSSPTEHFH